ncbi:hypothetical protein M0R88_00090 [Halorussus gelatinilyticus]|uniref:Uncharacterized protein n=1 Tax=Halorussus gelatinilyticus TaxID=2937524 RepID=A0A8U0IHF7_9EURY|nr:hypothetical protein [Halorussus gelatinilyticus]UPW00520.1 hypothetical protein M0R88_00090 [Halorussus gelatinilyticus]
MGEEGIRIRVRCRNCSFEKTVASGADEKPAEVLIDHGQRTGHTLAIDRLEE